MNDYEQRKQDRIDRYLEKAGKARAESSALSQQAHTMLSAIPPGQPMMPDHYSYKSDKRYRDRIDTKMRQSISADEKADYYEGKARAAANNRAISSDDPDAVQKLQEKLSALEKSQARMKSINAYYRKHQTCRGCEGITDEEAAKLDQRVNMGNCAVPGLCTFQQQSGDPPHQKAAGNVDAESGGRFPRLGV